MNHRKLLIGSVIKWFSKDRPGKFHILCIDGINSETILGRILKSSEWPHNYTASVIMEGRTWYLLANSENEWNKFDGPDSSVMALKKISRMATPGSLPLLLSNKG